MASYGSDTLDTFLEEVSIRPFTDGDGNLAEFRVRVDGIGTEPETSSFGLLDAKNLATSRQVVTSKQSSIVFEGTVRGGTSGVRQMVITDWSKFLFDPAYRYY